MDPGQFPASVWALSSVLSQSKWGAVTLMCPSLHSRWSKDSCLSKYEQSLDAWAAISGHVLTKVFAVCTELEEGWRAGGALTGCAPPPYSGSMVYVQIWPSGSLHKYLICWARGLEPMLFNSMLTWIVTWKYSDLWHVGLHLYSCPRPWSYRAACPPSFPCQQAPCVNSLNDLGYSVPHFLVMPWMT